MNLFLKYIQLTGAYADAYYQSELLKDTTHNVISMFAYSINISNISIVSLSVGIYSCNSFKICIASTTFPVSISFFAFFLI